MIEFEGTKCIGKELHGVIFSDSGGVNYDGTATSVSTAIYEAIEISLTQIRSLRRSGSRNGANMSFGLTSQDPGNWRSFIWLVAQPASHGTIRQQPS